MEEFKDIMAKNVDDGFFDIKYEQDGVYIIVHPSKNKGKKVDVNDVLEKIRLKSIEHFDKSAIELAVLRADNQTYKIADFQDEKKLNATGSVTVTPDKMKASLILTSPEGGEKLSFNDLMTLLKDNNVVYGVDTKSLETISKHPVYAEQIPIAYGEPSKNGEAGYVEYKIDIKKVVKPTIMEDGSVDYKEMNIIQSVNKGQILAVLHPPKHGIKGKTVVGTEVPAIDGKPAKLPKGRNVEVSEDETELISLLDGQVNYIDGKINVFATFEVKADVDISTGNIDFVGNVSVAGNVLSGFKVEAGGNVEVNGVVEGAVIIAGGDIILKRGMSGVGKGLLRAGGDIIAKYIENSTIEAKKNIKSEAIMHSNIKCGGVLELGGRKGLLVGGNARVAREISAKVIGSYMATVTDIEVGVNPDLRERYKTLKKDIAQMQEDVIKADQAVRILEKFERKGVLTPDKKLILDKSVRTKLFFSE
jgi:uncharacterized protein (DUF342 family)